MVVFSGEENTRDQKSVAFNLGADDYIVKTVDRVELYSRGCGIHSRAYWSQRQRRSKRIARLRESQRQLWDSNASLLESNPQADGGAVFAQVKQLTGLLPMCACCRRVRDAEELLERIQRLRF